MRVWMTAQQLHSLIDQNNRKCTDVGQPCTKYSIGELFQHATPNKDVITGLLQKAESLQAESRKAKLELKFETNRKRLDYEKSA